MPRSSVATKDTDDPAAALAMSSVSVPSGRVTVTPVAPAGTVRLTGDPGAMAPVGAADPPSSSPVRFDRRIGNATWSGRSERRGSNASTAVGSPARMPVYSSGAPFGPGMTVRAHVGVVRRCACEMWVVERST